MLYEEEKQKRRAEQQSKAQEHDWDICDLCMQLWERFKRRGYHGQRVLKLLSDESQDLHRAEILVLTIPVKDEDALVFAYDQAQTIAEGRKFDVKTVKNILFGRFRDADARSKHDERLLQLTSKLRPKFLRENFRTHNGILELVALLCVDTMKEYCEFDPLGLIAGSTPRASMFHPRLAVFVSVVSRRNFA